MKAIDTRYAGHRFRSRLEARWAVFFDTLGVRWEYEPEGYATSAGPYLPDFLLHLHEPVWFEVKPDSDTLEDDRWPALVKMTHRELVITRGMPRADLRDLTWENAPTCNGWMQSWRPGEFEDGPGAGWDNGRAFCICLTCEGVGIEFEGRSGRMNCCGGGDSQRWHTGEHDRIVNAYRAAHSARFEHGQQS